MPRHKFKPTKRPSTATSGPEPHQTMTPSELEAHAQLFDTKLASCFTLPFLGEDAPPSFSAADFSELERLYAPLAYKPTGIVVANDYRFVYRVNIPENLHGKVEVDSEAKSNEEGDWIVTLKLGEGYGKEVVVPGRFTSAPTKTRFQEESVLFEWKLWSPGDEALRSYARQMSKSWHEQRKNRLSKAGVLATPKKSRRRKSTIKTPTCSRR